LRHGQLSDKYSSSWRWRQQAPAKRLLNSDRLHGAACRKTVHYLYISLFITKCDSELEIQHSACTLIHFIRM
jgi:hypothetical protein